jgi:hypothetical protein
MPEHLAECASFLNVLKGALDFPVDFPGKSRSFAYPSRGFETASWVTYTARGDQNFANFATASYFHCSGLDLAPSPT